MIEELALTDVYGKPFPEIMRELVVDPIGMANSTFEQPLPISLDKPVGPGYYGVGFFVYPVDVTFPYFGHNGSNVGLKSEIYAHREKGYGVVILTNGDGGLELVHELRSRMRVLTDGISLADGRSLRQCQPESQQYLHGDVFTIELCRSETPLTESGKHQRIELWIRSFLNRELFYLALRGQNSVHNDELL